MKAVCFGDSNTYGYDPRGFGGGRYGPGSRWVDILAAETGWTVCNWGQNGREIPAAPPALPGGVDLLIVMLGTNDLLRGRGAEEAAGRLEAFLAALPLEGDKLLLIAPPPVEPGQWVPGPETIAASRRYAGLCRGVAARRSIPFADAGEWGVALAYDGVHFTEEGHRAFAAGLLEVLR